jgi:Tfp pilus assembly protein PilP
MQRVAWVAVAIGLVICWHASMVRYGEAADETRFAPPFQSDTSQASAPASRGLVLAQQVNGTENQHHYDAEGRRDPFESLVKEEAPKLTEPPGPIVDPTRPRDPLERFDLSSLQLMGIIWGGLGRRAIIRAPDGKGYFVTAGMYMGQNGGQIAAIENDRLIIREKYRDMEGRIIDKTLTIPIRRKGQDHR